MTTVESPNEAGTANAPQTHSRPRTHSEPQGHNEHFPLGRMVLVAVAILLSLFLGLASVAFADGIGQGASDDEPENPNAIELGLGFTHSADDPLDFEITNIRYSRDLRGPWYVEALATADFDDLGDGDRYLDISARRTLNDSEDWQIFALGGVGAWFFDELVVRDRDDFGFPIFASGDTESRATAHLGLGFTWEFHSRGYLRSDFLYRQHFDTPDFYFEDNFSSSIDLGWRF